MLFRWFLLRLLSSSALLPPSLPSPQSRRRFPPSPRAERPDALLQAWHELISLQRNQSALAQRDHPVDERLLLPLAKCARRPFGGGESAFTLAPAQIGIYAEMGHLTRFCPEQRESGDKDATAAKGANLTQMADEFRRNCTLSLPTDSQLPSLPRMFWLSAMGARLQIVRTEGGDLQDWARELAERVRALEAESEQWKLVLVAPGVHDLRQGRSAHSLAQDVLQSVQILRHRLPRRTFVLLLRHSKTSFWRAFAESAAFCAKMQSLWEKEDEEEERKTQKAWDLLGARLRASYSDEEFHVELADVFAEAKPVGGRFVDVSVLSADCVHLSARGLSLLHAQLWNWLVQPRARALPFIPLLRPPLCPRPLCPFLATARNSVSCPSPPISPPRRSQRSLRWWEMAPLGVLLLLSLALYSLLALCSLPPRHPAPLGRRPEGSPLLL